MDAPEDKLNEEGQSRRGFVKKAAYVTPAILTLQAAPAYAKHGSEKPGGDDKWDDKDKDKAEGQGQFSNRSHPPVRKSADNLARAHAAPGSRRAWRRRRFSAR